MKQKVWNQVTTPAVHAAGPRLSLTKAGMINFNVALSALLGIPKNGVQFIQDEDRPQDWYIQASIKPEAFKPRERKMNATETIQKYMIQNATLARAILLSCGADGPGRVLIAGEITANSKEAIGYAILTKSFVKSTWGGGKKALNNSK